MAGNDLVIGTDDTDHGTSSLFLGIAKSIEQTPVGSCGDTFFDRITLHEITSILKTQVDELFFIRESIPMDPVIMLPHLLSVLSITTHH
jgi:hypothetical protein